MNIKSRLVNRSIYYLVLQKHPVQLRLSLIFILLPLVIMLPTTFLIHKLIQSPADHYHYAQIDKEGTPLKARITNIKMQYATRFNNQHPSVISYTYFIDGKEISDEFKTLSPAPIQRLNTGDEIDIKVLNAESEITNLEPFRFPFFFFYFIPLPLMLVGIGFGLYLFTHVRKEIKLIKNGHVTTATITAITEQAYRKTNLKNKIYNVAYIYTNISGKTFTSNNKTTDKNNISSKKQGDTIQVFVFPNDESLSCMVPAGILAETT